MLWLPANASPSGHDDEGARVVMINMSWFGGWVTCVSIVLQEIWTDQKQKKVVTKHTEKWSSLAVFGRYLRHRVVVYPLDLALSLHQQLSSPSSIHRRLSGGMNNFPQDSNMAAYRRKANYVLPVSKKTLLTFWSIERRSWNAAKTSLTADLAALAVPT